MRGSKVAIMALLSSGIMLLPACSSSYAGEVIQEENQGGVAAGADAVQVADTVSVAQGAYGIIAGILAGVVVTLTADGGIDSIPPTYTPGPVPPPVIITTTTTSTGTGVVEIVSTSTSTGTGIVEIVSTSTSTSGTAGNVLTSTSTSTGTEVGVITNTSTSTGTGVGVVTVSSTSTSAAN